MKNEELIMEQIRRKALARKTDKHLHKKLVTRDMLFKGKRKSREVTLADLEDGYRKIAILIDLYGDVYLPIFIRLHKEIEAKKEADKFKLLAMKVANNNVPKGALLKKPKG